MNAHLFGSPRIGVRVQALVLTMIALLWAVPQSTLPASTSSASRVQPVLLDLAAQQPEAIVHVIVQSVAESDTVKAAIQRLGGEVTGDLKMINAVTASLRATAIVALGRSSGVRWVSLDAPMVKSSCAQCVDTTRLKSAFIRAVNADKVWNEAPKYLQGQGIGIAIVDSGINPQNDLYTIQGQNRIVASVRFNSGYNQSEYDGYGHGNHIAGIIGGGGRQSNGEYIGVAPQVNLINVKVSDDQGASTMTNVVQGLQWIYENKNKYNIRVVNLSLNSTIAESYHVNPLDAALEMLWFNGIVVVVSAGNNGSNGVLYPPANDPFVITVGATDDKGTPDIADDTLASFSAYGVTSDGIAKPDLVAPGTNLISLMGVSSTELSRKYPNHIADYQRLYFRMSGTSMAAPVVAGAAVLLLQNEPNLTPHQVKYRLMSTARPFDTKQRAGAGYLDVYAAVHTPTTETANNGTAPSKLAWQWAGGTVESWNSVLWSTETWNSVLWSTKTWNSVLWSTANPATMTWSSDYWGQ